MAQGACRTGQGDRVGVRNFPISAPSDPAPAFGVPRLSTSVVGQVDQGDPPVVGVATPLDQSFPFQVCDEGGHGWLGDPFTQGEIGDAARTCPVKGGERSDGREAQVPGHVAEDGGEEAVEGLGRTLVGQVPVHGFKLPDRSPGFHLHIL